MKGSDIKDHLQLVIVRKLSVWTVLLICLGYSGEAQGSRIRADQVILGSNLKTLYCELSNYCKNRTDMEYYPTQKISSFVGPNVCYRDMYFRSKVKESTRLFRFILGPFFAVCAFWVITGKWMKRRGKLALFGMLAFLATINIFSFGLCALFSTEKFPVSPVHGYRYIDEYVFVPNVPVMDSASYILAYERFDLRPEYEYKLVLYGDGKNERLKIEKIQDLLKQKNPQ